MRQASECPFVLPWDTGWLVAWEDRRTSNVFIAGAAFDAAGTTLWTGAAGSPAWVGVLPVAPDEPSWEDLATGAAAVRVDDGAMLVWRAQGAEHLAGQSIAVGLLLPTGSRRGTDFDVTTIAARDPGPPAIAFSGRTFLVAWEDRRDVDLDDDDVPDPDVGIWARIVADGLVSFAGTSSRSPGALQSSRRHSSGRATLSSSRGRTTVPAIPGSTWPGSARKVASNLLRPSK